MKFFHLLGVIGLGLVVGQGAYANAEQDLLGEEHPEKRWGAMQDSVEFLQLHVGALQAEPLEVPLIDVRAELIKLIDAQAEMQKVFDEPKIQKCARGLAKLIQESMFCQLDKT